MKCRPKIFSPIDSGYIKCAEGENPLVKMAEHYAALGCKEFAIENGVLWLRWSDGRTQKVIIDLAGTVQ